MVLNGKEQQHIIEESRKKKYIYIHGDDIKKIVCFLHARKSQRHILKYFKKGPNPIHP